MPYLTEEISKAEREKIKKSDFIFPQSRTWPIHDLKHGKIALTWALWPQHKGVSKQVIKAVFARYPELRFTGAGKKAMKRVKAKGEKAAPAKVALAASFARIGDDPELRDRLTSIRELVMDAESIPEHVHHDPQGIGREDGVMESILEARGVMLRRKRRR